MGPLEQGASAYWNSDILKIALMVVRILIKTHPEKKEKGSSLNIY